MSLTGLLTKSKVDSRLDDIFKSSAGSSKPSTFPSQPSPTNLTSKKRKRADKTISDVPEESKKATKDGKRVESKSKGKQAQIANAKFKPEAFSESEAAESEGEAIESTNEDDIDENGSPLVHESLKKPARKKKAADSKKVKYVPEDETREMRDARTIFIGNLPVGAVKSKPLEKQLKRHILSHVPSAAIESVRYRSVAFNNPTAPLPDDDADADGKLSTKQQRQQQRAADWRGNKNGKDGDEEDKEDAENRKGEKTYLMPAQKRRLAAIKGDVHSHAAATTNAYVVFAHQTPHTPGTNVPRKEVMDPYVAAREGAINCDGTVFAEHTIRVDLVGKGKEDAQLPLTDPKLSVFVGNLDFATTDDDLRSFFESLMVEELGKPDTKSDEQPAPEDDEENNKAEGVVPKRLSWVTRVRVVRDRDTQLGKGIAYVQFSDRSCIDEILALDSDKLKFAKRSLRVQRCKGSAATSKKSKVSQQPLSHASSAKASPSSGRRSSDKIAVSAPPIPKGDPSLGVRLAGLSKDQRKEAKASDPSRLARRLAKKKARAALEKAGVKEGGKTRMRDRKVKKDVVNTGKKDGKKRIRSDRIMEKRNIKK